MWLNGNRYNNLIEIENKYFEEHKQLKDLIEKLEEIKKQPSIEFITVEPLEADEEAGYWEKLAEIYDDRYFKLFMHQIREIFIKGISQNPVAVGGSLDAIDIIINKMLEYKNAYLKLLEAENEGKEDNEN